MVPGCCACQTYTVRVTWLGMEQVLSLLCRALSERIPSPFSLCPCNILTLVSYAWQAVILTNDPQF